MINCPHIAPYRNTFFCGIHAAGQAVQVGEYYCMKVCKKNPNHATPVAAPIQAPPVNVPTTLQPGDVLAALIHANTGIIPCQTCQQFQIWMNSLGWLGCWKERAAICQRLKTEAAAQKIVVPEATIISLVETAIKLWLGGKTE